MQRRFLWIPVIAAGLLPSAHGLPIRPKPERILKQAETPQVYFPPARAGWNGPENATGTVSHNPLLDKVRLQNSPEHVRAQVWQVLRPDWITWLAFVALIALLRGAKARWQTSPQVAKSSNVLTMPAPAQASDIAA